MEKILVSSKGMQITTTLSDSEARAACSKLTWNNFAQSLASKHFPSQEQMFWLHKVAMEAISKEKAPVVGTTVGFKVEDFKAVAELFSKAKTYLKKPKIHFLMEETEMILSLAPEKNNYGQPHKNAGCIYIRNAAFDYIGKIDSDGTFFPYKNQFPATLKDYLTKFAQNPAAIAAEHGKLTGKCCFCAKNLTDERSTSVGYGWKCSTNWGMPYPKN